MGTICLIAWVVLMLISVFMWSPKPKKQKAGGTIPGPERESPTATIHVGEVVIPEYIEHKEHLSGQLFTTYRELVGYKWIPCDEVVVCRFCGRKKESGLSRCCYCGGWFK